MRKAEGQGQGVKTEDPPQARKTQLSETRRPFE